MENKKFHYCPRCISCSLPAHLLHYIDPDSFDIVHVGTSVYVRMWFACFRSKAVFYSNWHLNLFESNYKVSVWTLTKRNKFPVSNLINWLWMLNVIICIKPKMFVWGQLIHIACWRLVKQWSHTLIWKWSL